MKNQNKPVEGYAGLVKDRHTGAILNINSNEINEARKRKMRKLQKNKEELELKNQVDSLKEDMTQIKTMLMEILKDRDGSNYR
jgi:hypothetical protein